MSNDARIQIVISAALKGVQATFGKAGKAVRAFNSEVGNGHKVLGDLQTAAVRTVGVLAGFAAIGNVTRMLADADQAAFNLEKSLDAANRQFDIGTLTDWTRTLGSMRDELRVFSESELQAAASRTIDMTKRLGLSADQMQVLMARTADLSAGKTDLVGGIERVTAAIRGEAEASEYLGLTLNETYVRAWHEAHNSMNKAWKDLTDLEKAQVRYNVFLEQAIPLQGKAADSVNTFAGAMKLTRAAINDAIVNNENVVEAMKEVAAVFRENGDEIGQFVGQVAGLVAFFIEFVAKNKEAVLTIGALVLGFGVLSKTITTAVAVWKGLNAAMLVMTGSQLLPWLSSVNVAMTGMIGTTMTLAGAITAAAAAAASLFAGYKIGEWITMRGEMKGIAEETDRLNKYTSKTAGRFREISQATGVTVTSMDELDKAVKDGRIHYDELTGAWKKGAADQAESVNQSAEAQASITKEKLKEMESAYQKYVDQVKKLQDQIAGRERSLAEELRAMARSAMSDVGAWRDRKKEAEEYYQAAKKAAAAGDFKTAVEYADKAKTAYKDLNEEVKSGDKVLVSQKTALEKSMAGVRKSGELAIEILKKQKVAAQSAADELNQQSGGMIDPENYQPALTAIEDMDKAIQEAGGDWGKIWDQMGDNAVQQVDTIKKKIMDIDGTEVTVYVNEVVKKAVGGAVRRLRSGGRLPGYGGGDRIPALLEAGEFIIRKEAVARFGSGLFNALNSMQLPALPRFKTGGQVAAGAADGGMYGQVDLRLGDGPPITVRADRHNYNRLLEEQARRGRLASS